MKPLHIGLLAVGATLAGGLAFQMTQPQTIPTAACPRLLRLRILRRLFRELPVMLLR